MMTLAEHEERRESLYRTSRAISAVAMDAFNKQCALHEYSWNDKLPAVIRESAQAAGEKYWEQYGELSKLSMAVYESRTPLMPDRSCIPVTTELTLPARACCPMAWKRRPTKRKR